MARRFKLRNGAIVEECDHPHYDCPYDGIYPYSFNIIDYGNINGADKITFQEQLPPHWLCLNTNEPDFPKGGAWGPEFDIVEEIKEESK